MKMYTNESQTAKMIELGFEKPKNTQYIQRAKARNLHSPFIEFGEPEFEGSYSIGELIEFIGIGPLKIRRDTDDCWWVAYKDVATNKDNNRINSIWSAAYELIDALYDMIIMLKEEGVI